MSRKITLAVAAVIIVIVILAGAFYLLSKSQKPQDEMSASPTQTPSSEQSGTIKSLLAMGKDVSCEVSYSGDQGQTKGTVYVSAGKMRGDFTNTDTNNTQIDSHMINDGTYTYSWSSASPQGVKNKNETASPVASASPEASAQEQGPNVDQQVQYKCNPWSVDSSVFTPPSDVQFVDMSAMMKAPGQTQPAVSGSSISPCEALTDPQAKAACEAAMPK